MAPSCHASEPNWRSQESAERSIRRPHGRGTDLGLIVRRRRITVRNPFRGRCPLHCLSPTVTKFNTLSSQLIHESPNNRDGLSFIHRWMSRSQAPTPCFQDLNHLGKCRRASCIMRSAGSPRSTMLDRPRRSGPTAHTCPGPSPAALIASVTITIFSLGMHRR